MRWNLKEVSGKLGCRKDVFYEFLNDGRTDWRKLMYHIVSQLWTKVIIRSDHKSDDTCLMVDDTDFPKTWSQEVIFYVSICLTSGLPLSQLGRVQVNLTLLSLLHPVGFAFLCRD